MISVAHPATYTHPHKSSPSIVNFDYLSHFAPLDHFGMERMAILCNVCRVNWPPLSLKWPTSHYKRYILGTETISTAPSLSGVTVAPTNEVLNCTDFNNWIVKQFHPHLRPQRLCGVEMLHGYCFHPSSSLLTLWYTTAIGSVCVCAFSTERNTPIAMLMVNHI